MPSTPKADVEHWWAQRWINAFLGAYSAERSKLNRARADARAGRVWPIEIAPGFIRTQVPESYSYYCHVVVELAPVPETAWRRVIGALSEQAGFLAQLLAGQLAPEIEEMFRAVGTSLFPTDGELVETACSCPVWAGLCKHVAAAHYAFALLIDHNPLLLFTLRGCTPERLVGQMRARWAQDATGEQALAPSAVSDAREATPGMAPLRAAGFYTAAADLAPSTDPAPAPAAEAAVLRRLGQPPFALASEDVAGALAPAYEAIHTQALRAWARGATPREPAGEL